uniref:HDC08087 n=1 Tax=Drosophila melanogaster TaxID=7227 RepID=Q6ILY5_DROME|nr:TPA_inf: HDC08087 [Drosophila melanogaster]
MYLTLKAKNILMTSLNFFLFSNIKPTLWLEPTEQQVEKHLRKVPDSKDTNHLLAPPLPIRWRTQRELSSDEMMTWPQGCKETGFPCDFRHHLGSNKEATAGAAVTALVTTTSTKS